MKLTQADFEKLITDVEKEFDSFLAKAESEAGPEESLAKSDKEDEAKEDSEKAEDKKEDKKDDDKHDYDDQDQEELHKMYASMGKAERELHKSAIEKCGDMSVAKSEQIKEEKLGQSEETVVPAVDETALIKSELEAKAKELDGVKKTNEDLKKNVEELVGALNGFLTKKGPTRKAITSIEYIKKNEIEGKAEDKVLTKSEITTVLNKKASDPSLSKADREAINQYYSKGQQSLEVVKHLLQQ